MAVHYVDHIQDIKDQVSMPELLAEFGYKPNRAGYICCPFHHEKTASLKVWEDHYKCFGCGASGDVIKFVEDYLHIGFTDAMDEINQRFELNLPFREHKTLREILEAEQRRKLRQLQVAQSRTPYERFAELTVEWAKYDAIMMKYQYPKNDEEAEKFAVAKSKRDAVEVELDNLPIKEGIDNVKQEEINTNTNKADSA